MSDQKLLCNTASAVTAGSTSITFSVPNRGFAVGLKSSGLAGSEVVSIYTLVNGTWVDTGEELTVAAPHRTMTATGEYTIAKLSTAGAVVVVAD